MALIERLQSSPRSQHTSHQDPLSSSLSPAVLLSHSPEEPRCGQHPCQLELAQLVGLDHLEDQVLKLLLRERLVEVVVQDPPASAGRGGRVAGWGG